MPAKKNFDKESIKKIHTILRELRERTESSNKKALSQRELASEMGIAHSRISKLEATDDETEPSISDLLAYRTYFDVSIDYLLGLESEPTTSIELKAISKEYGLSAKSLLNIKSVLSDRAKDCLPEDYDVYTKEALNIILESDFLYLFLGHVSKYFKFYPGYKKSTFAWCTELVPYENNDKYHEVYLEAVVDDFIDDNDKVTLGACDFDGLLLEQVKNDLNEMKKYSEIYYRNTLSEIEKIKKDFARDIESLKSSNHDEQVKNDFVDMLKLDRNRRIEELEKMISDYNIHNRKKY